MASTRGDGLKHMIPMRPEHSLLVGRWLEPIEIAVLGLHTAVFQELLGAVARASGLQVKTCIALAAGCPARRF